MNKFLRINENGRHYETFQNRNQRNFYFDMFEKKCWTVNQSFEQIQLKEN